MIRKNILLAFLLGSIVLNAQVLNIKEKWNLFGAIENLNNLEAFNNECVSSLYTYKQDTSWNIYPNGGLTSINQGIGFWVYATKDCSIDTDKSTTGFQASLFFASNCAVCHGDKGQGSRFRSIKGYVKSWYWDRLKPFQDGSRTSPSTMSGILKGFDTDNLDELTSFLATL